MPALKFILVFFYVIQSIYADRVVMTTSGPVQGISIQSGDSDLEAFLGIPYAEPPIGRLRFAKPVPKTPWSGVYDASMLPPPCIQHISRPAYFAPDVTNMTEDCLYLNIWAPFHQTTSKRLKPILFFIHGGAFNIGSSCMKVYDGAKLATGGDVVVVTLNYRIGVMGFFSAFISDAAGNMGLYDQIVALNWIRANAVSFQGDPKHIVLVGESAGAMSAAGHMLSPLTKHMVKRVILLSGAAMLPLIIDGNDRVAKLSQSLSKFVGCSDDTVTTESDPRLVVACLKRLPAEQLAQAEGILMESNPITFTPVTGDEYLPKDTIQMVRDGEFVDIEMLIGIDSQEGTFFLTNAIPDYFGFYGVNPIKSLNRRLAYQLTRMAHKILGEKALDDIANFYINNVKNGTSDTYTLAMSDSLGDYLVACNSIFHSEFHALRWNPVYFYVFSHRPASTPLADWMGTTHFDEVQYMFGNPLFENFTEEEELISRRMMDRWLAFAKTGNPNIKGEITWPTYSYQNPLYLDIDVNESVKSRPDNYRCEFWRDRFMANFDEELIQKIRSSAVKYASRIIYMTMPVIISVMY